MDVEEENQARRGRTVKTKTENDRKEHLFWLCDKVHWVGYTYVHANMYVWK